MTIFLHVCCGPCAVYPLQALRDTGHSVSGLFYNPNIHPFQEFKRRLNALEVFGQKTHFDVDYDRNYGLQGFLREVVFNETKRCQLCYAMRLKVTAQKAIEAKAEAFSTTLLYSRYQNHEQIKKICENIAETTGIPFYYEDFREGWQEGVDRSIEMELYRQPYCGCIYSEQERYDKSLRRKKS
nr:epoxyqueuosine reductase QueH [Desulfobulbaceae bacterium]